MWKLVLACLASCLCAGAELENNNNRHHNEIPITLDNVVNTNGNSYVCPPQFIRSGNSCYFFSTDMATWHEAHFLCKDRRAHLTRLEKQWEDRNMRSYLNKHELARVERWIGGIFNWESRCWLWGETGRKLRYQAFSRRTHRDNHQWRCTVMDPAILYRWGTRSCVDHKHYICETPLKNLSNNLIQKRKNRKRRNRKAMKECQSRGLTNCERYLKAA